MMDGENAECIVQYDWIVQITKKKIDKKEKLLFILYM